LAVTSIPQPPQSAELTALAAYRAHVADCLDCDPGAARHCHTGIVLHNRWATAQAQQVIA
jgi:hypothetical protein